MTDTPAVDSETPAAAEGRPATRRKALRILALVVVTIAALWGLSLIHI